MDENIEVTEVSKVVASRYRQHAEKQERDYESTPNTSKLPRLYFDTPEGKVEKIRGFDLCLKHAPENPYVGCSTKVKSRGLCDHCLNNARYLISKDLISWTALEAMHAALPSARASNKQNDVISFRDFILSMQA